MLNFYNGGELAIEGNIDILQQVFIDYFNNKCR